VLVLCVSSMGCRSSNSSIDAGGVDGSVSDAGDGGADAGPGCYEFASSYVGAVNALAEGRNSCTVDADCFSVLDTSIDCGGIHISACPVSVTVGNEDAVQAEVDVLRAAACDGRFTRACREGPTCGFVATCAEGSCNVL